MLTEITGYSADFGLTMRSARTTMGTAFGTPLHRPGTSYCIAQISATKRYLFAGHRVIRDGENQAPLDSDSR